MTKPKLPLNAVDRIDPMPQRRRELFLRVIDVYEDLHPITLRLHFLDSHFPPHQLERALMWLVINQIVGRKFVEWFKEECQNSDLEMHRKLLSIVENLPITSVVAGKNFKI